MVNMSSKFDKEICNGVGSIAFTRSTHGQTDGTTEPHQRCAGIIKNWLLKSDEEAHNAGQISDPYVRGSVTIGQTHAHTDRRRTKWSLCDLWPLKSIGFILSPWLTCLPSLIKKSTTVKSLLCSQAYFHRCPLWPWPLTSKINRVHPLIMLNMSSKFDKEICNGVDSIALTRSTHGRRTEPRNHSSVARG